MTQSGKPVDDARYEAAEVHSIRTDVEAMELETRMFERDNMAWSDGIRRANPVAVPGLRDLLASCEMSEQLCAAMQRDTPADSSNGQFLQKLLPQLQRICADIRTQMHEDHAPPQGDAVKTAKR